MNSINFITKSIEARITRGIETIPPAVFLKWELPFRLKKSEKGKKFACRSHFEAILQKNNIKFNLSLIIYLSEIEVYF